MTLLLAAPEQRLMLPAHASVRVFSFGGGVQSHAVLAMQALGKLPNPYDVFVFSNVGIDSENPDTLEYIERYTKPFCEAHGIRFVTVQRQKGRGKNKTPDTLMGKLNRSQKSIVIPMRMGHNGAPGNRTCTEDFKILVVDKWIKEQGYTWVTIGLGISTDEMERLRDMHWHDRVPAKSPGGRELKFGFWKRREYPLVTLRLNRMACHSIIEAAGLPQPPKSSCFFCPFKKRNEWIETKKKQPHLFQVAVELERTMNRRRAEIGRDSAYLHPDCRPLDQAVGDQLSLFPADVLDRCDSGFCWT